MEFIDGYPEYMRRSIKKVEATREERISLVMEPMSAEEREKVLSTYHPDYMKEGKRPLKVGASKGEIVHHETANILEARPQVIPDEIDLSCINHDVDILIIGGGGAGTVAALHAVYEGILPENVLVTTKLRHGDANSMMAQGGIQAADSLDDEPSLHFLDAMGGGHFANKPDLVKALVMDAPKIIEWHQRLGVMYDREADGHFVERPGGGTSRPRLHSAKDYTGMEIMRVIRDEARNLGLEVEEFSPAVELLTDGDTVTGAVLMDLETREYSIIRAKSVILATGGYGRLHIQGYPTTNHYGATADGLVLAYRVGAKITDMDSAQYHPTGAAFPEPILGQLITEKVRGMGAIPVNADGETFVFPLEPRDVESASFIRECQARGKGIETPTGMVGVWLDSPMIEEIHGPGTIKKELIAMWRMEHQFGIDMSQDPILVFPTLHYQNGGVEIDVNGWTGIPGLYAGGEVAGGVHGKNRLMGNSLLDYNVFGRRAGISAAIHAKKTSPGKITLDHVIEFNSLLDEAGIDTERRSPMVLPDYRGERAIARALNISI
ncbi:MAG TPA: FAD-binding protein [Methanomassiliicoccales archaeon]|nr:FAD-binding protein [Methanomassiliicoccales archaeon]